MGRGWLQSQRVPDEGIYLENCKYVDYGYFGNLEVFSQVAFKTLIANIDMCKASAEVHWKVGIQNGKYGPMGEDLFAQRCLGMLGVRRVEAFDITTDGACPADRPQDQHNNKKWKPNCAETSTAAIQEKGRVVPVLGCHHSCFREVSFAWVQLLLHRMGQMGAGNIFRIPPDPPQRGSPPRGRQVCSVEPRSGHPYHRQVYEGAHAQQECIC